MVARKAAVPEFVEAEVLEAEVVDEGIEKVSYTPAVIDAGAYLEAKGAYIARMMEPYADLTDEALAQLDDKAAKACRADVNRIIKEAEDERKLIKKAYEMPLKAFESQVAAMLAPAKEAEAKLHALVDAQAEAKRNLRRQSLQGSFEIFAPALVPVVPFERVLALNPKWLNASYNGVRATEEMEDAVAHIASDWEALKAQEFQLRFYQETEAEFFRTLDIAAALAFNARRCDEQDRIDAMRAEVEANREAAAQEPAPEPQPEPKSADVTPVYPDADLPLGYDMRESYVIRIDLSEYEKQKLMAFIVDNGIGANRTIGKAVR